MVGRGGGVASSSSSSSSYNCTPFLHSLLTKGKSPALGSRQSQADYGLFFQLQKCGYKMIGGEIGKPRQLDRST